MSYVKNIGSSIEVIYRNNVIKLVKLGTKTIALVTELKHLLRMEKWQSKSCLRMTYYTVVDWGEVNS